MRLYELKVGEKASHPDFHDVERLNNGDIVWVTSKEVIPVLKANWQLIQEHLPVGEWITNPSLPGLEAIPKGSMVAIAYENGDINTFLWNGRERNLEINQNRIYILPDPGGE